MRTILFQIGRSSYRCLNLIGRLYDAVINTLYAGYVSKKCKIRDFSCFTVQRPVFINRKYITIYSGNVRKFTRISSISQYRGVVYNPHIRIGKNANIGINNHIGAIDEIINWREFPIRCKLFDY